MGSTMRAKIGLGIVTTPQRKDFFKVARESVELISGKLDQLEVAEDTDRQGVAVMKNQLFKALLQGKCTHIFIMEDDMQITDGRILAMYIAAARLSGVPHLNFSQHGPNTTVPYCSVMGPITYWPNACGAFSYYTREILEEYGLMDENFKNAYEHVEHSWRIYKGKLSYGLWPDLTGSDRFIQEQPGAIERSNNGETMSPERLKQINEAREYWFSKDPECPLPAGII